MNLSLNVIRWVNVNRRRRSREGRAGDGLGEMLPKIPRLRLMRCRALGTDSKDSSPLGRLEAAVARLGTAERPTTVGDGLEHPWWRLNERRQRRTNFVGSMTSLLAGFLARYAGLLEDNRFAEGAITALERLHDVMQNDDGVKLKDFCDATLARSLEKALEERRASAYDIEHGCEVLRTPRIAWWRLVIGVERREATWTDDDEPKVKQDFWALDARRKAGILVVLPKDQFEPLERAFLDRSPMAVYSTISDLLDKQTVSVQAVVDFPRVREALVALKKKSDDENRLEAWPGSTDGFVTTSRQLILEAPAFRTGIVVPDPIWTLIDVDNITNGGGSYWRLAIEPY